MTIILSQFLIAFAALFTGTEDKQNNIESIEHPFAVGEEISYKLKYGWFTIGKANVRIPSDTMVSNQKCYNVHVEARTAGVLNLFHNTVDQFEGAVAHDDLKPKFAYQNFLESGEREIQANYYNYDKGQVIVEKKNRDGSLQEPNIYSLDPSAFDIISSYLYLRSLDGKALSPGDSIMIKSFYGKKHYDFGLEYVKKETIDTKIGELRCHMLYVLFPVSSAFPHKKGVRIWVTADKNQLPVKIEAKLKFGKVTCDLTEYKKPGQSTLP